MIELKDLKYCTSTSQYYLCDLAYNQISHNNLKSDYITKDINEKITLPNIEEQNKLERRSIFLSIIATIFGALISFHGKIALIYFPLNTPNNIMFVRSFVLIFIAMVIIKMKNRDIPNILNIKLKLWLFIRTLSYFLHALLFTYGLYYIRLSTMMCFGSISPLLIILFSTVILNEKFRNRYIIGIFICFIGTSMIISNERNSNNNSSDLESNNDNSKLYLGIFFGIINFVFHALYQISAKVLVNENMENDDQILYIAFTNTIYSLVYLLMCESIKPCLDLGTTLMNISSGIIFYIWTTIFLYSIKNIEISKLTPISYISVIFSFFLGYLFLGEDFYLTDVLGSAIILGYNLYNVNYPPVD